MSDTCCDLLHWIGTMRVDKWRRTEDFEAGLAPDESIETGPNLLMNAGITRMWNLVIGTGATQAMDATHCRIGVGDSNTAASAGQTDLQASSNKRFNLVTSGPTVSSQSITLATSFSSSEANWAWEEWCVDFGTASSGTVTAPMLNRKVQSMGTKASGSTWTASVTLTLA
ncbi:MAG TPA: hypothetical protein VJQ57_09305 [Acidimicrobiia bacterium]|nr:hypothetical protein [Acidimicrobiia bacterium]